MGHSMISLRWVVLVGLSAIVFGGCGGSGADERANEPAPPKAADAAHARTLQELLDVQRDGYGATAMAAAIIVRSRLVWSGGSGVANRETKAPVTADTPFPIFSIMKMFVGALAVKLAQEGRLKLDDPLSRTLPEWPDADRITLRMLLNQTSGVGGDQRRMERDIDARPRAVWTPRKTLGYSRRPHDAPAEKWKYNNANYVLAGLVIERATGGTVAKALRELILDPLKLHDPVLQPQEVPRGEPAHATEARRRLLAPCGSAVAMRRTRRRPRVGGRPAAWLPAPRRWLASPTRFCAVSCSRRTGADSCCGSCRPATATTATALEWARAKRRPGNRYGAT